MNEDRPAAKDEPKSVRPVEEKVGTHPLAGTAGAVGGAVAGAVAGIAAGPLGSLVGAVGGAVAGATLGASSGSGPVIDLAAEEQWWRENHAGRPYVAPGMAWEDYEPAYRYGMRRYVQSDRPREWSEVESDMARGWDDAKGTSRLTWAQAQDAVRAAWDRMREPRP
jgi:hypothetical protein